MRDPDPNFTPEEAAEARAYLRENASEVQKIELREAEQEGREPRFIITDTLNEQEAAERAQRTGETVPAGEEIIYVTENDELIVDYWRHLLAEPLDVGRDMPDIQVREDFVTNILKGQLESRRNPGEDRREKNEEQP